MRKPRCMRSGQVDSLQLDKVRLGGTGYLKGHLHLSAGAWLDMHERTGKEKKREKEHN